jgi:4-amino-4-deoxychorismate lyase
MDFVSYNGGISKECQIPLDQGFLYGYGIFETINVRNREPIFFDEHMERFKKSALVLGLKLTTDRDQLLEDCKRVIKKNQLERGGLRITLSKGIHSDNLIITARANNYHPQMYENGVKISTNDYVRNEKSVLVSLKSNNYLENLLILNEAKARGYAESIFHNTQGDAAEGCMTNLFFVKDGQVYTPSSDCGLLAGIVRNKVIQLLREKDIPVLEGHYQKAEWLKADEVFLTNSLMEIMPVSQVDDYCFAVGEATITRRIIRLFQEKWSR